MTKASRLPYRIASDERGNVLPAFALMSIVAVGAVGGAVDFGRAYQQRSKIQNALDGSISSGLRTYQVTNDWTAAQSLAQDLFGAQFSNYLIKDPNGTIYDPRDPRNTDPSNPNYAPSKVPVQPGADQPVLQYAFQQAGSQLTGTATMTVTSPFWQLVTGAPLDVRASSIGDLSGDTSSSTSGQMLEVSMMVDLTGSMGETRGTMSKIAALKLAGADLLDILLPSSGANDTNVRVAVAPFADYVNAGEFASKATGLAAEGGAYANITNLASTRQGAFYGSYSGYTSNAAGSQHGATPTSATSYGASGSVSSAGATYSNGYCSNPTSTTVHGVYQYHYANTGESVSSSDYYNGAAPTGMLKADSTAKYHDIQSWYGSWTFGDARSFGYYVPLVSDTAGLTTQTRSGSWWGYTKTGNVGQAIESSGTPPSYVLKASTSPGGGFWHVSNINWDGSLSYEWRTYGYYLPMYTSLTTTGTTAGCETTVEVPSAVTSKLISCVTERIHGTNRYTAATPNGTNGYAGAFNHGNSAVQNYSSDGKCYVAGRELPSVIPLTNSRSTLTSFFENATIGGGTPGHLGTAWAWYLLSPDWATVWPATSAPVSYTNTGTKKVAIIMTDGEYNKQYSGEDSSKQALMLCKAMRDAGITIYTIGFGFSTSSSVPNPNIEGMSDTERTTVGGTSIETRAKDVLAKCASKNANYFFPYDGEALRTAFQDIGSTLATQVKTTVATRGARINH